jgi:hypothetical protein
LVDDRFSRVANLWTKLFNLWNRTTIGFGFFLQKTALKR